MAGFRSHSGRVIYNIKTDDCALWTWVQKGEDLTHALANALT